ncbi:hypothetical protein U1Q18_032946 [Sarracenia purpurea var. burkii]
MITSRKFQSQVNGVLLVGARSTDNDVGVQSSAHCTDRQCTQPRVTAAALLGLIIVATSAPAFFGTLVGV